MSSDEPARPDPAKPKIIVDDDWKERVQAEKEALRAAESAAPSAAGPAPEASPSDAAADKPAGKPAGKPAASASPADQENSAEYPPASFESLISLLVTQALAGLGQIPLGPDQKPAVMLDHAKHSIDLLGVIEEKTKGNLSAMESAMLTRVLDELRMIFVSVKSGHT